MLSDRCHILTLIPGSVASLVDSYGSSGHLQSHTRDAQIQAMTLAYIFQDEGMCPACCSNIGRCPRAGQDLCAPSTISPNIRCPCSGTHLASLPYLAASALPRCMYNGRFVQHAARLCHCRYPETFQRVDPWLNGMIYPPTAACLPCGVRDRRSGLTIVVLRRVR